jgi:hypothetical protein
VNKLADPPGKWLFDKRDKKMYLRLKGELAFWLKIASQSSHLKV